MRLTNLSILLLLGYPTQACNRQTPRELSDANSHPLDSALIQQKERIYYDDGTEGEGPGTPPQIPDSLVLLPGPNAAQLSNYYLSAHIAARTFAILPEITLKEQQNIFNHAMSVMRSTPFVAGLLESQHRPQRTSGYPSRKNGVVRKQYYRTTNHSRRQERR